MADLKQAGTMPLVRDVFMILVMAGTISSMYCFVRGADTFQFLSVQGCQLQYAVV